MIEKFNFPYSRVSEWIVDEIFLGNLNSLRGIGGLGWYLFFYYVKDHSIFNECDLCIDKDYITTLSYKFSYNNKIIEHLLNNKNLSETISVDEPRIIKNLWFPFLLKKKINRNIYFFLIYCYFYLKTFYINKKGW